MLHLAAKKKGPPTATTIGPPAASTTVAPPATTTGPHHATKTGPPSTSLNIVINNVPAASNSVPKTVRKKIVRTSMQSKSVPIVKPRIVGENIVMVPKKCMRIGMKRKADEMEPLGT